jgi:SOS-response transcriptional repressor LexA
MSNLTQSEEKILDFIRTFQKEKRRSPTMREIAKGCGYSGTGFVHRAVQNLADSGNLQTENGVILFSISPLAGKQVLKFCQKHERVVNSLRLYISSDPDFIPSIIKVSPAKCHFCILSQKDHE